MTAPQRRSVFQVSPVKFLVFPKKTAFVSGIEIGVRLFKRSRLEVTCIGKDGDFYSAGQTVLEARGTAEKIHSVYKTVQNILEYSSGITNRVRAMTRQIELPVLSQSRCH